MDKQSKVIIAEAEDILNGLCQELDMARSASDPYPPDSEHEKFIVGLAHGYISEEREGWFWHSPNIQTAKLIVERYAKMINQIR